jgi:hypothetical protein
MTKSLPGAGPTNRRGVANDGSSDRLESSHTTPLRGRSDQHTTSGLSDTPRERPSTLVHSIAHEAKYLKGASITRDDVSKFVAFLEHYDANALGKLVTEKPVDFVGFDNVVEFNKNRQNDDNVVKAYKS